MKFPDEWALWNMLPDELYMNKLISSYIPGMEDAAEHDRNGCFHWWLKKNPSEQKLLYLAKLSKLDPDNIMAIDIQAHIKKAKNYSEKIRTELCV